MSEEPQRPPAVRAADIAAETVARLVAQAEATVERMAEEARAELAEIRAQAEREAEEARATGRRDAEASLADARTKAIQLGEDARKEAKARVEEAAEAADRVLSEARALSSGLRQLGSALTNHAERILKDVQAGHRRMQADLRLPDGGAAPAPRARRSTGGGSPFEDIELPEWVAE